MKSLMLAASLCFAGTVPAHAAYSGVVAFGDSLADAGNLDIFFAAAGLPDPTPDALGYFDGRFSNGPTFVDVVATSLSGELTRPSLAGGSNFAFGGALATDNGDFIFDFAAQVGLFAAATGGVADPQALYIVNFGGNDGFAILNGAPLAPGAVGAALADGVAQLAALGARNFLVLDVVDLAVAPILNGSEMAGSAVSIAINAGIDTAFAELALPADARVFRFDTFAFSRAFAADPGAYGLPGLDTETTCIAILAGPQCTGLNFIDSVHPTAVVHEVFGRAIFQVVPEPAALALFGLGTLGLVLSRRRG